MHFWGVLALLLQLSVVFGSVLKEKHPQNFFGYLRTTFSIDPTKGFNDEPRLRSDAESAGWNLFASGCDDGSHPYPGYHMIQDYDSEAGRGGEIALIYDSNGYIAGIRGVTPIVSPNDPDPKYFENCWYRREPAYRMGFESYMSTVYFVHPSKVCAGRTREEFETQGTGTGIYVVAGPSVKYLLHIPPSASEAESSECVKLYRGACFNNMGIHYFTHNSSDTKSVQPDCRDAPAVQILYGTQEPNELIGFVLQNPSTSPGNRWEIANPFALKFIFGDIYPQCFFDLATRGARTMHVYLRDQHQTC